MDYGVGGGLEHNSYPSKNMVVITAKTKDCKTMKKCIDALNPDEVLKIGGAGCKVH